jgi:hypothetical protein
MQLLQFIPYRQIAQDIYLINGLSNKFELP